MKICGMTCLMMLCVVLLSACADRVNHDANQPDNKEQEIEVKVRNFTIPEGTMYSLAQAFVRKDVDLALECYHKKDREKIKALWAKNVTESGPNWSLDWKLTTDESKKAVFKCDLHGRDVKGKVKTFKVTYVLTPDSNKEWRIDSELSSAGEGSIEGK